MCVACLRPSWLSNEEYTLCVVVCGLMLKKRGIYIVCAISQYDYEKVRLTLLVLGHHILTWIVTIRQNFRDDLRKVAHVLLRTRKVHVFILAFVRPDFQ